MNIYPPVYITSKGSIRDVGSEIADESQGFGANVAFYSDPAVWGANGTQGHPGLDFGCVVGTQVYASVSGTVKRLATDFREGVGFGAGVEIENSEGLCLQWHLSRIDVQVGQVVNAGDKIGLSGNTGQSSGPHLHLEWRPYPLQANNGFLGAVDPTPLLVFQPIGAMDIMTLTQEEVNLLYASLGIDDKDGSGHAFWAGKQLTDFLRAYAQNRINDLKSVLP